MGTLHDWFTRQAERTPEAASLTAGGTTMSYRELHELAGSIAGRLVAAGVRPDDLVPVFVPRRLVVPAITGVLMAGAAYVPLDPRYPDARLGDLVERVGADVVVTADDLAVRARTWPASRLVSADLVGGHPAANVSVDPDGLAYVMFTSGSTGVPKGVQVTHRNVTRLMTTTADLFHPGPGDVWTMLHSYAFDFSVWEMWGALLHGGRLVVVEDETARAPDEVLRLLDREGVTVLNQTPSALTALAGADEQEPASLDRLRLVILGGERLDPVTLAGWFARRGDERPEIVNMYGITETTVHVTYRRITAADTTGDRSPIGVPLPDLAVSLRDENGAPVATGDVGEMWISGPGLARGYLDHDTDVFRMAAWGPGDQRRTYLSGDLARAGADGQLYYAGRRDDQVKVRGYRIELGEVSAALRAHPLVTDACVATDTGESVGTRLLAWVTVRPGGPDPDALRSYLADRLPAHSVPSEVEVLDRLPLTPNGKIDRRRLLDRPRAAPRTTDGAAAGDPFEAAVARIWAEELEVAEVGPTDDFFALGGHSLIVGRVVSRTRRELGSQIRMQALFEAPRLADFVERARAGR